MPDAAQFQEDFGRALAGLALAPDAATARALTIHRNTASLAARDALADNFPVVRALVGDDAFFGAAMTFVEAFPPADPRLCLYGDHFPVFLQAYDPFAEMIWLGDVGMLERLVVEALFSADADVGTAEAFATVDLDAVLTLHPATRFTCFDSPAGSLWQAHQPAAAPDAFETIDWRGESVVITRPFDAVIVTIVPDGAISFLQACHEGRPLAEAAQAAGSALPEVFACLISAGAFA